MVNHIYDEDADRTLCGQYAGHLAWSVSGERYSCPECIDLAPKPEPIDSALIWMGEK